VIAVIIMILSFASICLIPLGLLLILGVIGFPIAGCAYSIYAAMETYQGKDFKYCLIGDTIRRIGEKTN